MAIDTIERIVEETGNDADFVRVPGYLHARVGQMLDPQDVASLRKDAELARSFGFEATFTEIAPYSGMPAVQFAQQAKFHPRKYLKGLLTVIQQQGGVVFENTAFESVDDGDPMTVHANGPQDPLQVSGHRDPQSLDGQERRADGGFVSNKAGAVHQLRHWGLACRSARSPRARIGTPTIRMSTCGSISTTIINTPSSVART